MKVDVTGVMGCGGWLADLSQVFHGFPGYCSGVKLAMGYKSTSLICFSICRKDI